jgi:hypothetical protein
MTEYIGKDAWEILEMRKNRKSLSQQWMIDRQNGINPQAGQEKRARSKAGPSKSKVKSNEFVNDSDDEEEAKPVEKDEDVDRDPESSEEEMADEGNEDNEQQAGPPSDEDDGEGEDANDEGSEDADFKRMMDSTPVIKPSPLYVEAVLGGGRSGTPNLAPRDFVKRCRTGRK